MALAILPHHVCALPRELDRLKSSGWLLPAHWFEWNSKNTEITEKKTNKQKKQLLSISPVTFISEDIAVICAF